MEATSRGFKIHYVDAGSGPPLVLMPGLLMSVARWQAIGYVDDFARDFRVLAVDPLGHGLSDKPHDPRDYLLEDCALDVLAVLDHVGVDKAHIWGYSRGGYIAVALAAATPERLLSLIIGGSGLRTVPEPEATRTARRQRRLEMADALRVADWPRYWAAMGLNDPATQAILQAGQDPAALAAAIEGMGLSALFNSGFDARVLRRPPLIYDGSEESTLAEDRAEAQSVGAEFHVIPGRGHSGAFQDIAAVSPIVRAYLTAGLPGG